MKTVTLRTTKTTKPAARWTLLGLFLLFILSSAHSVWAQQGYIYVHKKTLDEASSLDFAFNVSGGTTSVPNFSLNDNPAQIQLRDIGSSQNGRLWAVGQDNNVLYYRNAGTTNWVATAITDARRVDGGPAGTAYYVTTGGIVRSHDGTSATTISGAINAVDIGSGWDNQPYVANSSGNIIRYSGTGTTWNPFFNNAETLNNVDVSPSDGYVYATSSTTVEAFRISPAGVGVSMGKPADVTTSGPRFYDIAADALGNVFIIGFSVQPNNDNNRFVYKWISGTSWSPREVTTNQVNQITGGLGGQVWGINRLSWDVAGYPYHNIFTRALDGTTNSWIDDERVRTSVTNGNSIMIPVAPGTYTITETVPGGWDLQKITVYDPSSNSTSNLSTRTATVTVASNEVVHVIFQNGIVNPFAMTNSCTTVYTENFGTGAIGTFGPAFVGQTSYHYIGNSTLGEDGYYKIVGRVIDFNDWGVFLDHTTNNGTGRMLAVNASYDQNEFFRRRFTGVVPGADYQFSAWIANLTPGAPIDPNVSFQIIDPTTNTVIASNTTGNLTGSTTTWLQYTLQFTATTSEIDLVLVNNNIGGVGNDLAIDDIVFQMAPPDVATTTVVNGSCAGNGSITVTAPIGASYEYSLDGTTYQSSPAFTNLPAGAYTVYTRFVAKPTCVSTKAEQINTGICGNVFNDANGLTDNTVNGPSVNGTSVSGTPIYASLVSGGVVIATVPVTSTGTYSFSNVANGTYSVVLTTNSAGSTTPSLPTNWVSTGENIGTAAGNDGTVNSILPVTVSGAPVNNANLGIEQRPVVTGGTNPIQVNPGGTIAAPVSSTLFTGTDPEDGMYPNNLTGRTVTLTPATNGTLYYNGMPITTTTVIPNFDPTKVTLDPTTTGATTGTGGAAPDPTFTYTVTDNAGVESLPATIIVPFTAALPVSLMSFTATAQADQRVLLEWKTAWERSNKGYTLERSKDLITFETVGQVSDVAGTSQSLNTYRFMDTAPFSGTSYYRLSQTDMDGTTKVFPAISVVIRSEAYGIFPNPVRDGQFTLNLDEPLTAVVKLYAADGRPVGLQKGSSTDSSLHLKASQPLTPGVYLLRVEERGQLRQYRIVIN